MRARPIFTLLGLLLLPAHGIAQERTWTLDAADEDAFLVYGVPESDDVGVSIWCKIGTERATLFMPVPWTKLKDDEPVTVNVTLGEKVFALAGKATASAEEDGSSLEAEIPPGDAFFDVLKTSDRIKLELGTHKSVYPLEGINVEGLLSLCRQQPDTLQAQ